MAFTDAQVAQLRAKLDGDAVKQRSQAGRSFSYIEGWHAIAECNRIFGFDAWDRETVELRLLGEPREVDGKWRVGYMAKVRIEVRAGDTTIARDGCGFGSGIDRDVGQAHESALKEAETDAMKRALMTFGNPFGLALYDKTQENVDKGEPPPKDRREPAPRTQQAPQQQRSAAAPSGEWEPPRRPAEVEIPRGADGKLDLKLWLSRLMLALSRCERPGEPAEWLKLNNPTLISLKEIAPDHYKRVQDYAATIEREVSNPMAA